MREMVERVARAIREGRQCSSDDGALMVPCPFCDWGPDKHTDVDDETGCIWLADAAIKTMLEPTPAMVKAGMDEYASPISGDCYRAMIAAALEEPE